MQKTNLAFSDYLHPKPQPSGIDVSCKLQHFAIITYSIDPKYFGHLIPQRFGLDTVTIDGKEKVLLSVVPFIDVDFTSAVYPFPKFTMKQTNYRIYVVDKKTGEHCVWFLGTTFDSWVLAIPRHLWQLPWYNGSVRFDCAFDLLTQCYTKYEMETQADWAPAHVELIQNPEDEYNFSGFPDPETALVYLTHPLTGFYYRRDGLLGTYKVWHKKLHVKPARLQHAYFGLLSRMGLVNDEEQQSPHSVLIQPKNEFTIYLPPKVLGANDE